MTHSPPPANSPAHPFANLSARRRATSQLPRALLDDQPPFPGKGVAARSFSELGLAEPILRALREEGYAEPTLIQSQAIPPLLEGRDLIGCARTGTGKTAAFLIPILQRLSAAKVQPHSRAVRALVLVPTRELAIQVRESHVRYGRHLRISSAVVHGGVGQGPQVRALAKGLDVLVATPGRLLDLAGQGHVRLDRVEVLVLDEADQMLDLGFLPDMKRIISAVPKKRQTLLFSATMPPPIAALAHTILTRPARVVVTPIASTVDTVEQRVHLVDRSAKADLLATVLSDPAVKRALVFTRTKRGADRVARGLRQRGIRAEAIHGDKTQGARNRALDGFRGGRSPVLVATDVAARGLDVDNISHVINFEIPNVPEVYVHRIGRTARAGAKGVAISFCDGEEDAHLREIENLTRRKIHVAGQGTGQAGPVSSGVNAAGRRQPRAPARSSSPANKKARKGGRRNSQRTGRRTGRAQANGFRMEDSGKIR